MSRRTLHVLLQKQIQRWREKITVAVIVTHRADDIYQPTMMRLGILYLPSVNVS